jgi:hypothetical protein
LHLLAPRGAGKTPPSRGAQWRLLLLEHKHTHITTYAPIVSSKGLGIQIDVIQNYVNFELLLQSIFVLFFIFIVLIIVVNLTRLLIKYFDYTINKQKGSLLISYGLINTNSTILKPERHKEDGSYITGPLDTAYYKNYYHQVIKQPYTCPHCNMNLASRQKIKRHEATDYCTRKSF